MSVMNQCFICGAYYKIGEKGSRLYTCSDRCHEKFVERLIREFGEFKKVCSVVTGKCYRVPTRHIIEKGLTHDELIKFPEWEVKVEELPLHQRILIEALKTLPPKSLTGDVYSEYAKLVCEKGHLPLTQRRITALLSELADLGLIDCEVVNLGRYGRSKLTTLKPSLRDVDRNG